jgi:hypothetical protein
MVKILKVRPELIQYVYKLYPGYKILKGLPLAGSSDFISHYDITFILDLDNYKRQFNHAIILSSLIAEEEWDRENILSLAVKRSREWGISRRQKPVDVKYDFEASFNYTLFGHEPMAEPKDNKEELFRVFNSLGRPNFREVFFEASNVIPLNRLRKAVRTRLERMGEGDGNLSTTIKQNQPHVKEVGHHVLDFVQYCEQLTKSNKL